MHDSMRSKHLRKKDEEGVKVWSQKRQDRPIERVGLGRLGLFSAAYEFRIVVRVSLSCFLLELEHCFSNNVPGPKKRQFKNKIQE